MGGSSDGEGGSNVTPVTLLAGFLGSGKTTLLQHILTNAEGRRIAVIVNDVASLNVDAALARAAAESGAGSGTGGNPGGGASTSADGLQIQLENGCICCNLRTDLAREVLAMAAKGNIDAIVVEASGIAEPQPIQELFAAAAQGTSATVALDTTVVVVDCERFLQDYMSPDDIGDRESLVEAEGAAIGDRRDVSSLLVSQVEAANVILLNKTDLVTPLQLEDLTALVATLNPKGVIHHAQFGRVDLDSIIATGRFTDDDGVSADNDASTDGGTSVSATDVSRDYSQSAAGRARISSFVYGRRRPFHPSRLHNLVVAWKTHSILRSKGFVWVAGVDDAPVYWSHAGNHLRLQPGGDWAVNHWHPVTGHRYSEIAIIGVGMEQHAITDALDACLLRPAELGPDLAFLTAPEQSAESQSQSQSQSETKAGDDPAADIQVVVDGPQWTYAVTLPSPSPIRLVEEPWKVVKAEEARIGSKWLKVAYLLASCTILYNLGEGFASVWFSTEDEWDADISLLGFGMDSFIEVLSACFVLLRLCRGRMGTPEDHAGSRRMSWERQSMVGISCLLMALGVSAIGGGVYKLAAVVDDADTNWAGVVISLMSLSGMFFLWYYKMKTAVMLNSAVLEADAACSLGCIHLSWVLLAGSVLRQIEQSLWFVDGIAAVVLGLLILRDGIGTFNAARHPEFDGCGCGDNASWLVKRLHKKLRTGTGNLVQAVEAAGRRLDDDSLSRSGGKPVFEARKGVNIDAVQIAARKAREEQEAEAEEKKGVDEGAEAGPDAAAGAARFEVEDSGGGG